MVPGLHSWSVWDARGREDQLLVDRFNSLLAVLDLPVRFPTLGALATPTLLLTVLEAILETRIIDVPSAWRAQDSDPGTTLNLVSKLLRAINQVVAAVTARTGGEPPIEAQVDRVEPANVVAGDAQSQRALVHALLWIAAALDVKSRPSSQRQRKLGALGPDTDDSPALVAGTNSRLFSPRPLGPSTALPAASPRKMHTPRRPRTPGADSDSASSWRRVTVDGRASPAAAATTAPRPQSPPTPARTVPPPPTTPNRSHLPGPTSFLAELARTRSPGQASGSSSRASTEGAATAVRAGVPFGSSSPPPVSPRKSIVQVMRSLEERRRLVEEGERDQVTRGGDLRGSPPRRGHRQDSPRAAAARPVQDVVASQKTKMRQLRSSSVSTTSSSSTSSSTRSRSSSPPPGPRSRRIGRPLADSSPDLVSTPPCTCASRTRSVSPSPTRSSPSPTLLGRVRTDTQPPPPSADPPLSATTFAHKPTPGRIRLLRISPTALNTDGSCRPSLSVHSSTDLYKSESEPPAASRTATAAALLSTPPPPPPPTTRLVTARSTASTETTAETPSPYTLLLLAQRDRLREKLRILERRERDRKAAAAMGTMDPRDERPGTGGMIAV
ncbi:hypothetical protein JCM3774_003711 [Rhodotorula dairenensis]